MRERESNGLSRVNNSEAQSSNLGLKYPDLEEGPPSRGTRSKSAGRVEIGRFRILDMIKDLFNMVHAKMAEFKLKETDRSVLYVPL